MEVGRMDLNRKTKLINWLKSTKGRGTVGVLFLVLVLAAMILFLPRLGKPPVAENTTTEEHMLTTIPAVTEEGKTPTPSEDETRGIYIASVLNLNFPSKPGLGEDALKSEMDAILSEAQRTGFDTVYFQVRPTGDALYPSQIFPSSRYLVKEEGDPIPFDVLSYFIEKASSMGIDTVAWVNPYRITNFTSDSKEEAIKALSPQNPASQHPDWTVFYGGKLYYNPALGEVRNLIASGLEELCAYDLKGILYDDYFYPYPVSGEVFDDQLSYVASSSALSLEDWRRDNVNKMVKLSYDTIKRIKPEMTFGVSPFGIWQNASSTPAGSDTKGMEAYSSLYCDALAWIEGEYVDYIAPQIYWERGNAAADFATLCRWWSAQVDGTKVKLMISHAAYKAGEFELGGEEIALQIQYARNYMNSVGNIQYGFADIQKNTGGVRTALQNLYADPYEEEEFDSGITGIRFARPTNGGTSTLSAEFVTAASDPAYPVYSKYGKVGRTKSGFFSVLMPLTQGNNTLTFTQNGKDYTLKVKKTTASTSNTMKSFQIESITPSDEDGVVVLAGESFPVSVTAPANCTVTVELNGKKTQLKATLKPTGSGLRREVYRGEISAPSISGGDDFESFGFLSVTCSNGENTVTREGSEVFVIPEDLPVLGRVTKDYSYLKISPDSSFYDDYTPASLGMTDRIVGFYEGYWKLGFGGYVAKEEMEVLKGSELSDSVLTEVVATANDKTVDFALNLGSCPALDVSIDGVTVLVKLFRTDLSCNEDVVLPENNFLFRSCKVRSDSADNTVTLVFQLKNVNNYYGFTHVYTDSGLVLKFTQPQALPEGDKPLEGKRIVVDAGHGGTDSGAMGFLQGHNEEDLNLRIALLLRDRLEELGAQVTMSRTEDTTVSLTDRMELLNTTVPDFSVSVHHNSTNETKDANKARGTLGLYWSPSGVSLSRAVQQSVSDAIHSYDEGSRSQKLALCRNHRFPQMLLETSYICSPAEFQWAMRSDYSKTCADAIAEGILDWYEMQEGYLTQGEGA